MRGKKEFSLSKFFLRNYALGLAVLTFSSAFLVFHIGKTYLISAREDLSFSIAKSLGHEIHKHHVDPIPRLAETSLWDGARLDSIAQEHVRRFGLARINILNLNNRIVYSTDTNLVGMINDNQMQFNARQGVPQSSLVSDDDRSSSEQTGPKPAYFESFIPWWAPGDRPTSEDEIIGAFQIYQDATGLNQNIVKLRNAVLGTSLLFFALVCLYFRFALTRARGLHRTLQKETTNHARSLEKKIVEHTEKLNEEKNILQVILNHVPSAFVLVDTDFRIQSTSAALREFTGKSLAEVKNQFCYDMICKKLNLVGTCPTRKALHSNRIENTILTLQQNGNDRYFEHVAVPITNNGKTESILEIITDITEKKKMQDSIIQAEKLSAVGQMAATIAHEMRNALTSVKLILQHLAPSLSNDKNKNKAANVALESINDMENVVKQLLDFARPTPTAFKTTDINKLVRHSVELCRNQIESKHLKLYEDYATSVPRLLLDAEHMRDAVVNLILNAVQASRSHDTLCIQTKLDVLEKDISDDFIERKTAIQLKRNQQVVKIEISDKGCGIPVENRSRIFEPFFTTKIDGSGLGLPVTRRTVHEHGGILMVDSLRGEGSTFTIILPA